MLAVPPVVSIASIVVPVRDVGAVLSHISEPAIIRQACVVVTEAEMLTVVFVALLNGPADVAVVLMATMLTHWFDVVVETTLYVPTGGLIR